MIRIALASGMGLAAAPAWAEVCDKVRPNWDPGTPATAWSELIGLMGTPPSLVLLLLTGLVLRFRHQWGGVAIVVLWTIWISVLVFLGADTEAQKLAIQEGCVGSPTLFIAVIAAICVATILYTAPRSQRP